MTRAALLWVALGALACGGLTPTPAPEARVRAPTPPPEPPLVVPHARPSAPTNVLVVVLDDVGAERLASSGLGLGAPPTPTLDRLAATGRSFRRAWAMPMCSPTRAALLTGRYPRRTGLGEIVDSWTVEADLADEELTLAELWPGDTSFVGKWHLDAAPDPEGGPLRQGFGWFRGTVGNLRDHVDGRDTRDDGYFRWMEVDGGRRVERTGYVVSRTADDTLARVRAMEEPWLAWSAFHAVHVPFHAPPPALLGRELPPGTDDAGQLDAMLEVVDRELGRVLDGLGPELLARTTVIVVGDNGTPSQAVRPPLDASQAKGTVYELGVRVPLLVTGPLVGAPGPSDALVSVADVFATVAEIAGVDPADLERPIDGVSLLPALADPSARVRRYVWTERFSPNGLDRDRVKDARAVRDERFKLVVTDGEERLFDLAERWFEEENLLARPRELTPEARAALGRLRAEHDRVRASFGSP